MDFAQFKARLKRGVLRDDLEADYGEFTNEALVEIQNRRDWLCMKSIQNPVVVPASIRETLVKLPDNFKSLQKIQSVFLVNDDGSFTPAEVKSEAQRIRSNSLYATRNLAYSTAGIYQTGCDSWPPPVFVTLLDDGAYLGCVVPLSRDLSYRVDYYGYLPTLVADGDLSPLITQYPKMVLAKAKAIAFSDINDATAELFEEEFEKKFAEASRKESHSEVAGRVTRM